MADFACLSFQLVHFVNKIAFFDSSRCSQIILVWQIGSLVLRTQVLVYPVSLKLASVV